MKSLIYALALIPALCASAYAKDAPKACRKVDELKKDMANIADMDKATVDAFKPLSPEDFAAFKNAVEELPPGTVSADVTVFGDKSLFIAFFDAKGCVITLTSLEFDVWAKIFGAPEPKAKAPAPKSDDKELPHGGDFSGRGPERENI